MSTPGDTPSNPSNDDPFGEDFDVSKIDPNDPRTFPPDARAALAKVLAQLPRSNPARSLRRALWGVSGCLFIVIVALVAILLVPYSSHTRDADKVANNFLEALRDSEFDAARIRTDGLSDEQFFARATPLAAVAKGSDSIDVRDSEFERELYLVTGAITDSAGVEHPFFLNVRYIQEHDDQGVWRVVDFALGTVGQPRLADPNAP